MPKPTLIMLAAHEPNLDPRIKWEATSAAKEFDVHVIGLKDRTRLFPEQEDNGSYKVTRIDRNGKTNITTVKSILDITKKNFIISFIFILFFIILQIKKLILFSAKTIDIPSQWLKTKFAKHTISSSLSEERNDYIHEKKSNIIDSYCEKIKSNIKNLPSQSILKILIYTMHLLLHITNNTITLSNFIKGKFNHIDVIHCNDFDTLVLGIVLKRHFKCRLIYDAHEFWPNSLTEIPTIATQFFLYLEGFFIQNADIVITVNPLMAEQIKRVYGLQKVESIVNAEPWQERQDSLLDTKDSDKVIILYQGNFAPERGLEEFVDAWCKVNPQNGRFYLRGPKSHSREKLEEIVKDYKLDNIFFLPPVTEDELVKEARFADIGLIPYKPINVNYLYCCPNKLSQYMHAGLAIIANNLPFVKSVVEDNQVGCIYDISDPESIRQTILQMTRDVDQVKKMKKASLVCAREVFSWQQQEEKLLSFYRGKERS